MVGGATNQPPQATQLAPVSITTEEEEFLKRNTDCVYFLASPLTCKKGNECEYRHSGIARVNPRDCWYWLNGNCLNPKCGFRHPPLDGLFGSEVPAPTGPAAPQAPVKQGVACIFFQKGYCLKGQFCPFLHGPPNIVSNVAVQPVPPKPVTDPSKLDFTGSGKHVQEQKSAQNETVQKPVKSPPLGKQVPRVQQRNNGGSRGVNIEKKVAPPPEEPARFKPASVIPSPVVNEFPLTRCNRGVYETNHVSDNEEINGKDVEEYSREPTPGFDVLVDNEVDDAEYYPNEEQFRRSVDYDVDHDMYPEKRDFDHYNNEGYAWEDRRVNDNFGRKQYARDESPNQFEHSDLRHRLSKLRGNNVGGLRSVISREHPHDNHNDRIARDSHHDNHHDSRLDSGPLSSRLRGRIKIPGRSRSPGYANGSRVERHRSRYSPDSPPHVPSNHGRFRDRIRDRSSDDFNNQGRDYRGHRSGNGGEFTGPKRRPEFKSQQVDDSQTLGKRKYPRTESQQPEVNLSFEGPKPLSEILKRKRRSVISSTNNEDNHSNENNKGNQNNQNERKEIPSGNTVNGDNEKSTNGQSSFSAYNEKSTNGETYFHQEANVAETKAGSVDEDALLDQELEAYDHKDADYDYDQIDEEDNNLQEGEEYMEYEEDA